MLNPRRFLTLAALGDVSRSPGKIFLSIPSTTRRIDGSQESSAIAPLQLLSDAWPTIAASLVNLGSDRNRADARCTSTGRFVFPKIFQSRHNGIGPEPGANRSGGRLCPLVPNPNGRLDRVARLGVGSLRRDDHSSHFGNSGLAGRTEPYSTLPHSIFSIRSPLFIGASPSCP